MEEMGLNCDLTPSFQFIYRAELGGGLIEHELDHVFTSVTDRAPDPDAAEAADWRYVDRRTLEQELGQYPERFSSWLPLCVWQAWDGLDVHKPALRSA